MLCFSGVRKWIIIKFTDYDFVAFILRYIAYDPLSTLAYIAVFVAVSIVVSK